MLPISVSNSPPISTSATQLCFLLSDCSGSPSRTFASFAFNAVGLSGGAAHGAAEFGLAAALAHRHLELGRNRQFEDAIEIGELLPIEPVECHHRLARIVISEPPEPARRSAVGKLAGRIRQFLRVQ